MRLPARLLLMLSLLLLLPISRGTALADSPPLPAPEECAQVIDAFHGPCGHPDGPERLSGVLLQLVPQPHPYEFMAYVVECADSQTRQYSGSDWLFDWLATYDQAPEAGWDRLIALHAEGVELPQPLLRAALVLLWGASDARRQTLLPLLRQEADDATQRLALQIATNTYPDPFARGLGTELDITGTLYRPAFAEAGLYPICVTCPAEPRGTEAEQRWAELFLAIHPREMPTDPTALAKQPLVQTWLARYRSTDHLTHAQAALVLWRLQAREAVR